MKKLVFLILLVVPFGMTAWFAFKGVRALLDNETPTKGQIS